MLWTSFSLAPKATRKISFQYNYISEYLSERALGLSMAMVGLIHYQKLTMRPCYGSAHLFFWMEKGVELEPICPRHAQLGVQLLEVV